MNLIRKLLVTLLTSSLIVMSVEASDKKKKPLKERENPDLIGKRDINKRQVNIYSLEREAELGKRMATALEARAELVKDPGLQELINRVTQNIVINSDSKSVVTAKVIDSPEINAFALPGGYLYVNRGLIEAADNEAELAGVIAHEVAHIAARHSIEQASRRELIAWVSRSLNFLGGGNGSINRAASVLSFKFSRDAEKEADRLAAQYLWKTGYDPQALITFLEKLRKQEKKTKIPLRNRFRTHPMNEDRIKDTSKLVARFPKKNEYQLNSSGFITAKDNPEIEEYDWKPADTKKKRRLPPIKFPIRLPIEPRIEPRKTGSNLSDQ
jgi:beta-barrel assembly-enhancing protease